MSDTPRHGLAEQLDMAPEITQIEERLEAAEDSVRMVAADERLMTALLTRRIEPSV